MTGVVCFFCLVYITLESAGTQRTYERIVVNPYGTQSGWSGHLTATAATRASTAGGRRHPACLRGVGPTPAATAAAAAAVTADDREFLKVDSIAHRTSIS